MKAMENYIPSEFCKNDTVDAHTFNTRDSQMKEDKIHYLYKKYPYYLQINIEISYKCLK